MQQAMEDLLEDEDEDYDKDDKVIISLSVCCQGTGSLWGASVPHTGNANT